MESLGERIVAGVVGAGPGTIAVTVSVSAGYQEAKQYATNVYGKVAAKPITSVDVNTVTLTWTTARVASSQLVIFGANSVTLVHALSMLGVGT